MKGIISEADVKSGKVQVIAPAGFMDEAISENVLAGNIMSRRALTPTACCWRITLRVTSAWSWRNAGIGLPEHHRTEQNHHQNR